MGERYSELALAKKAKLEMKEQEEVAKKYIKRRKKQLMAMKPKKALETLDMDRILNRR